MFKTGYWVMGFIECYNKLRKWKLKLSITKTVTTTFHLYNEEAQR